MKFQRLLALTDLSENSCAGLAMAEKLARRLHAQVVVGYVHTQPEALRGFGGEDADNAKRLAQWVRGEDEEHLRNLARRYIDRLHLSAVETVDVRVAREGIPMLIERVRPDLVCMSTHGRTGLKHMLLGSIAEHTIRTAEVPVIVTKGGPCPDPEEPLRVLVGIDLVDEPHEMALRASHFLGSEDQLVLAHVVESYYYSPAAYGSEFALPQPDVPGLTEAARSKLAELEPAQEGPQISIEVLTGRPGEALLQFEASNDIDVTVARTHGRRGFDRMMLGSVSELLARRCKGMVLIYPKVG
jgi:nucleotide-binding universal stress UspA family protein